MSPQCRLGGTQCHPIVTWWHSVSPQCPPVPPGVTPMSPQCPLDVTWWHSVSPRCHRGAPRCRSVSPNATRGHPLERSRQSLLRSQSARASPPLSPPTPSARCACAAIAAVEPRGERTNQRRAGGRGTASLPARRRSGGAKMFYHVSGTGRGGGAGGGAPEGARGAPEVVQGGGKGGSWDLQWGGGAD